MSILDIWNTPGFFYAIGYSLATAVVLSQEKTIRGRRWKWIGVIACWLFFSVLLELTGGSEGIVFVLSMLSVIAAMFVCFYLNTCDAARSAFLAVKTFIYGELLSSLCWQVYFSLAVSHERLRGMAWLNAIMFGVFLALAALLWMGERWLHKDGIEVYFTRRDVAVELLVGLSVYVVSNLGYIDRSSLFSGSNARDIFAIRTLVDFSGAIMIYFFHLQLIEVQRRLERETLRGIREMQYQAYQHSRESIELVNQKYHDLKHQIALLRQQADSGKAQTYLDQLERDIRAYEAQNRTGNDVLDAILTNKSLYCQNHGIELKCIADGKSLGFMDDMEIAALFGNMLDNAIESSERIKGPEKRLIRLYVSEEKGFLRVRIENYCEERIRFEGGLPLTTKRDKRYHGFGMKSMRRTVEKYGGSIVAGQRENWFELKILIPLNDSP